MLVAVTRISGLLRQVVCDCDDVVDMKDLVFDDNKPQFDDAEQQLDY
jgi:hypothetical protein